MFLTIFYTGKDSNLSKKEREVYKGGRVSFKDPELVKSSGKSKKKNEIPQTRIISIESEESLMSSVEVRNQLKR
jgi:hypothetical protein